MEFHFLILLLCTLFLSLLFFSLEKKNSDNNKKKKFPPSPAKFPIIGNLHQLGLLPHRALQSLSNKYGPLMLLHFGSIPVVVVSSIETAREIMRNQDLIFSNRPHMPTPNKVFYGGRDVVFSSYGEYWRQMKSICVIHLLSNKKVRSFHEVMEEETSNMIMKIRGRSTVNMSEMIVSVTNDVICRVALGKKYDEKVVSLTKLFIDLSQILGCFNVGEFIPRLGWINRINGFNLRVEKVIGKLDEILDGFIEERRGKNEEDTSNFLDILLEFQKRKTDDTPLEIESIKAIILDMFIAGTDTTSSTIEWAMTELMKNPAKLQLVQKEIRGTGMEKNELPYLKAVIKETLRLHPPQPILLPREATQDTKIMNYDISANTRVLVNAWAISNDPFIWESPQEFRPERFLTGSIDFKGHDFELIPFGAGRRGCPGIAFATSVAELVIAKLVYNFDLSLPNGETEDELDMSESFGTSVRKRLPLLLVAK